MTRVLIRLLVALACALPLSAEAAVTITQTSGSDKTGDNTIAFGGNTTTGNTVVVVIRYGSGTHAAFSISDATNGTYAITGNHDNWATIFHFRNITGGWTTVSIDAPASDTGYYVQIYELSGASASLSIVTDIAVNASGTVHQCADSGGLSGTGFAACVGTYGAVASSTTPGSGWTLRGSGTGGVVQDKIATFTNELGPFTTGSSVDSVTVFALFPEEGGAPACTGTFCDAFTRADNTDLGASWDSGYTAKNNLQIVSNRIRGTALGTASVESTSTSITNDQRGEVTLASWVTSTFGVAVVSLRMTAPATQTAYTCTVLANAADHTRITEITAGSEVTLANETTSTWSAGHILRCEVIGSTINLYQVIGGSANLLLTTTDGSLTSGRVGLATFVDSGGSLANIELDDFVATDISSTGAARGLVLGVGQ